jgi:DNA topoisomerase-1
MEENLEPRWNKKRNSVYTLRENLNRLKSKVYKDLKSENEKQKLIATIIRIMINTSERVGNKKSSENGHFGVSQFRNKHLKVSGSLIELDYKGKSGVDHSKVFKDKTVADIIAEKKKQRNMYLFTTSDGLRISPEMVNNYLSEFDITSKDIRGFNANRFVLSELIKVQPVTDEKERKKVFNQVLNKISEKIGHTKATLRKQYLLPEIEESFYKTGKINKRINNKII